MFKVPSQKRQAFAKHFIDRVFCEIRFERQELNWDQVKTTFEAAFAAINLTATKLAQETKININADEDDPKRISNLGLTARTIGLDATTADGKKVVELRADRLIVSDQAYDKFEDFWNLAASSAKTVGDLIGVQSFDWIGIRKVNAVTGQIDEQGYSGEGANPMLFAPLRNGIFDSKRFVVGEFYYVLQENDVTGTIRGSATKDSDPQFVTLILDFDFTEKLRKSLDLKELSNVAEKLNQKHFDLFCWAVDPDLLEEMKSS